MTDSREQDESSPQQSPIDGEAAEGADTQRRKTYPQDGGSDDDLTDDEDGDSLDALEERFHGLEEEVATLVADVHDLALFAKLNITGFMKILKVNEEAPCFVAPVS